MRRRMPSQMLQKIAVTSFPGSMTWPRKIQIGFLRPRSSYSRCKLVRRWYKLRPIGSSCDRIWAFLRIINCGSSWLATISPNNSFLELFLFVPWTTNKYLNLIDFGWKIQIPANEHRNSIPDPQIRFVFLLIGFGMLESGCVSVKNEVNIMMKNIVDIVLGGFTYWLFGYGMSFGRGPLSNPFIAIGDFLLDPLPGDPLMGPIFGMRIPHNHHETII